MKTAKEFNCKICGAKKGEECFNDRGRKMGPYFVHAGRGMPDRAKIGYDVAKAKKNT